MFQLKFIFAKSLHFLIIFILILAPGCSSFQSDTSDASELISENEALSSTPFSTKIIETSTSITPSATSVLFGAEVDDPILFKRVDKFYLDSSELYSLGRVRTLDSDAQIEGVVGFQPLMPSTLPAGFVFADTGIDPYDESAYQCFDGPKNTQGLLRPQFCIMQRSTEFVGGPIGKNAKVYQTQIGDLYAEYAYGGWLAYGKSESGNTQLQWDNRMVPTLALRYVRHDDLFIQISYMGSCTVEGRLSLSDLISIAQSLG